MVGLGGFRGLFQPEWFHDCCRAEGDLWAAGWHRKVPRTCLPQLWLIPCVCTGQEQLHMSLTSSWSAPRATEGKGCSGTCQILKLAREKLPIVCVLCWFCTAVRFQPSRSLHSWCHTPLFSPPLDWGDSSLLTSWGDGSQFPMASGNLSIMSRCHREHSLHLCPSWQQLSDGWAGTHQNLLRQEWVTCQGWFHPTWQGWKAELGSKNEVPGNVISSNRLLNISAAFS